ncbi:MAG: polyprenyl synthetase family protein [Sedimentisphaerales bacterium]|nr:polyprenyl synthetase family protein [Sedimentisphaerales bacterium]
MKEGYDSDERAGKAGQVAAPVGEGLRDGGDAERVRLGRMVDTWFERDCLREILRVESNDVEHWGLRWLAKAGKRYRPLLTAGVYEALTKGSDEGLCGARDLAVAVECFHKASLIHDDIEDADDVRYGDKTLGCEIGTARALNVGDWLLGKGYELLGSWGGSDEQKAYLLRVAAQCHCQLCAGQGQELAWRGGNKALTVARVLEVFRDKTSPAFRVALQAGAAAGQADEGVLRLLDDYSEVLGIAYQIRDDIEDSWVTGEGDLHCDRPSLVLAMVEEYGSESQKRALDGWLRGGGQNGKTEAIDAILADVKIRAKADELLDYYRGRALECLAKLPVGELERTLGAINGFILD